MSWHSYDNIMCRTDTTFSLPHKGMKNNTEVLALVDKNDHVIGQEQRNIIYEKGLQNYRVVGIFLLNEKREILLQKRSDSCMIYPGCFDFSVAGHVLAGENYEEAANREMEEELGIPNSAVELIPFFYSGSPSESRLSSFSKYYYAFYQGELRLSEETDSFSYLSFEQIELLLKNAPDKFKSDFSTVFFYFEEFMANRFSG